jgi:type IV secretion system protein VirB1
VQTLGEGQAALQAALSAYNTGDFARGFANGYVARYYGRPFPPWRRLPCRREKRFPPLPRPTLTPPTPRSVREMADLRSDSSGPRDAVLSETLDNLMRPGVVVVDPAATEALGVPKEEALSEDVAWEANCDIDHEVGHGE